MEIIAQIDDRLIPGNYSDVEMMPIRAINKAFARMLEGDVRYRFVIDMASLKQQL